MPPFFQQAFIVLGWREAPWYFGTNWRVISRWVNESGKDELLAKRAAMRRNPKKPRIAGMMADTWRSEPQMPVWVQLVDLWGVEGWGGTK